MTETQINEELVMALADGELDAETEKMVRAAIEKDPNLRAVYEDMVETGVNLVEVFGDFASDDKYQDLVKFVRNYDAPVKEETPKPDNVIQVSFFRRNFTEIRFAATLVVGIGIGGVALPMINSLSDRYDAQKFAFVEEKTRGLGADKAQLTRFEIVKRALKKISANPNMDWRLNESMPLVHQRYLDALALLKKGGKKNESDALSALKKASEDGHPLATHAMVQLVSPDQKQRYSERRFEQVSGFIE